MPITKTGHVISLDVIATLNRIKPFMFFFVFSLSIELRQ